MALQFPFCISLCVCRCSSLLELDLILYIIFFCCIACGWELLVQNRLENHFNIKKKKKVYFKNVIKKMRESNAAYQMVGYFFIDAKEAVDVILLISRPKFKFVVKYRLYLCI